MLMPNVLRLRLLRAFSFVAVALLGLPDAGAQAPAAAPTAGGDSISAVVVKEAPDSLTLFGDVRFRLDADQRSGTDVPNGDQSRTRPRLRARLGVKVQTPVDGVTLGIRVATNSGLPGNSPHQTLDPNIGGSGEWNFITIDRAFLKLARYGAFVVLGKQGYPHWQQTEIFWDSDIQPEGFLGGYALKLGDMGKVEANLAYYYLANTGWRKKLFENDAFTTWQLRYSGSFGMVVPTVAVTGMHMRDAASLSNTEGSQAFRHTDFYMASAQIKSKGLPVTVTAGFDVVKSNAQPDTMSQDHTSGWVAQIRVGIDRFAVRYYYYDIREASVPFWGPAVLSQDNFPNSRGGGLTGFAGHRIQADAKIGKNVNADFRVYMQKGKDENVLGFAETPGRTINRYQLNLNAKF